VRSRHANDTDHSETPLRTTLHALIAVLLAAPLLPTAAAAQDTPLLTVDVVHGAHGDAMVWRAGCGEQALVDAGNGMADEVLDVLDRHGDRHLDIVSPSHADADHLGDVLAVTGAPGVTVGTYVDGFLSAADHDTQTFADYYATTRAAGNVTVVDIGDAFTLCDGPDAVVFDVLAVGYDGTTVDGLPVDGANDRGIVYRVTVTSATSPDGNDVALLSAGDINGTDGGGRADVEGALVAAHGERLAVDWVKVPHRVMVPGSSNSCGATSPPLRVLWRAFKSHIAPRSAVIASVLQSCIATGVRWDA
jgi:beta-lactamase superfamily II metal-dependent hydrolase